MKFLIPKKKKNPQKTCTKDTSDCNPNDKLNFSSDVRDTHSVTKGTIMSYYLF